MPFLFSIVKLLLPDLSGLTETQKQIIINDCYHFLKNALQQAPFQIRIGEKILRAMLWGFLALRVSSKQSSHSQQFIESFEKKSKITAGIIRLYRSFIALTFFEHPLVVKLIECEPPNQHHLRKKAERNKKIGNN